MIDKIYYLRVNTMKTTKINYSMNYFRFRARLYNAQSLKRRTHYALLMIAELKHLNPSFNTNVARAKINEKYNLSI